MTCACGRSPDHCRGWHNLSYEEWQQELEKFKKDKKNNV
jgi:hypothetical protein